MRILFNGLQADNRSGTGRYAIELAAALYERAAAEVIFLWPERVAPPFPETPDRLLRGPASTGRRLLLEQSGMVALCRGIGADMVHYPASVGPLRASMPVVLTVHDLCCQRHPEWFSYSRVLYYRAFMGPSIRRAARIIADSKAAAADIVSYLGIPESRIDVAPLGVSAAFQPASAEAREMVRRCYNLPERFFLFLGTLEPRKNLPRVVAAWSRIADHAPDLVIAGRVGWKTDAKLFNDAPRGIHCLGHVPQDHLPALYSAATAFVWPSLMEGFGLPPLEAMACGAPVVTSNTSSLPEVVGNAALTVDPMDVSAIAEAMEAVALDGELRERLRQAGFHQAARFTWEAAATATLAAYDKAAQE